MVSRIRCLAVALLVPAVLLTQVTVRAEAYHQPARQVNVYDLVDAVNSLRLAFGLAPYTVSSILMFTAQNQAEYMASIGQVTHSGPGGISLTERLLAAGYPLAGDLSLGGFRAENITSGGESMTAQAAVERWMGDAPHQNTMLSPNLTEIGAGVAIANGRVYLVIDCAQPTAALSASSVGTAMVGGGTSFPAGEALIAPVVLSTPNAKGEVIHDVQYGQTLWQLAISYDVRIDDIKRMNGLFDDSIYPGTKLLIKIEPTLPLAPPTAILIFTPTADLAPAVTLTVVPSESATVIPLPSARQNSTSLTNWAIAIVALAILSASALTWLGAWNNTGKTG